MNDHPQSTTNDPDELPRIETTDAAQSEQPVSGAQQGATGESGSPTESSVEPKTRKRPGRTKTPSSAQKAQASTEILNSVITLSEAIDEFDLKKKKTRKSIEKGQIPARDIGKDWLIRREDAVALWGPGSDHPRTIERGPEHAVLDAVITAAEAASELGVERKIVRRAAKAAVIPARKLKKGWLICRADLSTLIADSS